MEAQCERAKFSAAVSFLSDVLTYPHFTGLKINTTAANLLSNIPSFKQSATDVLRALHDGIFFDDDNNIHYTNFVRCRELRCGAALSNTFHLQAEARAGGGAGDDQD